jgi:hypothetical protein
MRASSFLEFVAHLWPAQFRLRSHVTFGLLALNQIVSSSFCLKSEPGMVASAAQPPSGGQN